MVATRQIKDTWTPLRAVALPLVADPDWRASATGVDDMKAAHPAGLLTIVPNSSALGLFELTLEYVAGNGNLIIPASNSRATIEFLEVAQIAALSNGVTVAKTMLIRTGDPIELRGDQSIPATQVGGFRRALGVRFISTQNEPIGATLVQAVARFA